MDAAPRSPPSTARLLRDRLEREDAAGKTHVTRGGVLLFAVAQIYMLACWLLGVLPGTQLLLLLALPGVPLIVMLRLSSGTRGAAPIVSPVVRSWISVGLVLGCFGACVPAGLQMTDFAARALLMLLALLTMMWAILRQRTYQQVLCGAVAAGLYVAMALRLSSRRLQDGDALGDMLVLAGMVGAVVQIAYLASHVNRIRLALDVLLASLAETLGRMEHAAMHDATTGLPSRAHLDRALDQAWAQASGAMAGVRKPLSACLFEPAEIGRRNEMLGETGGDEILRRVARVARDFLARDPSRADYFVGRFGGTRFLLLMPATDAGQARAVVQELRAELDAASLDDLMPGLRIDPSFGLATAVLPDAALGSSSALLTAASTALLRARALRTERIVQLAPQPQPVALTHVAPERPARPRQDRQGRRERAREPGATRTATPDSGLPGRSRPPSAWDLDATQLDEADLGAAARIGSAQLPWRSPFFFILWMALGLDVLFMAACWALGVLSTAVLLSFSALAGASAVLGSRVGMRSRQMDRAQLAWVMLMCSVLPVIFVTLQLDQVGARVGFTLLNAGPLAAGILFLNTRRYLLLAGAVAAGWMMTLGARQLLGGSGTWPADALLALAATLYSVATAVLGGRVYAIRSQVANYSLQLRSLVRHMSEMTRRDDATGLPNRRGVLQHLQAATVRSNTEGAPLTIVVAELRDAHSLHETLGPVQLEQRAAQAATTLRSCVRDADVVGMLGPATFLMVLAETTDVGAAQLVERVRELLPHTMPEDLDAAPTLSFGVAQWTRGQQIGELLASAESAAARRPASAAAPTRTAAALAALAALSVLAVPTAPTMQ